MKNVPPWLSLVEGYGTGANSRQRKLALVETRARPSEQLTFGIGAKAPNACRILSVGLEGLEFSTFYELMVVARVKYVVDIRHLASFRGRGFTPTLIDSSFQQLGIVYERCLDLVNPFLGTSQNSHWVLQQYATTLRQERSEALDRLADYLAHGTVLLLGRSPVHFGTEREVVTRLLAERLTRLELLALSSREAEANLWAWSSLLVGLASSSTASPGTKSRKRSRQVRGQLPLLDPPPKKR
jgi:hypothetical protein